MPRPDAAKIIGENLHNLTIPGPDGRPVRYRLLSHSTVGHSPQLAEQITRRALDVGAAIVHTLEANGYTITHTADPAPTENLGPYIVATAHCAHCAGPIHTLTNLQPDPNRKDHFTATLYKQGIEAIGLDHKCWE